MIDAGLGWIVDFVAGDGDRLVLEGAGAYTLRQTGVDLIVDLALGGRIALAGVNLETLPSGWLA